MNNIKNIQVCYCIKDLYIFEDNFIKSEKYHYYKEDKFSKWVFKDSNSIADGYRFFNVGNSHNFDFDEYFIPLKTLKKIN